MNKAAALLVTVIFLVIVTLNVFNSLRTIQRIQLEREHGWMAIH